MNFDVLARFRAHTRGFDRAVRQATRLVGGLGNAIGGVARMAAGAGGLGGIIGVIGLGSVTKDMIGFNSELEASRVAIAAMLQQASQGGKGGFGEFNTAVSMSNRLLEQFRIQGAKLPGTTAEFKKSFEVLLPVVARAGGSLNDVLDLAGKAVVGAKIGNVTGGADVVARDIRQILSGSASAAEISTVQLQGPLKELIAAAKKDQNLGLRKIAEVLTVSDEALKVVEKGFDAQLSTLQDNSRQFVTMLGSPVFQWLNNKLSEANVWLTANKDLVKETAERLGKKLIDSIEKAGKFAREFYDRWVTIKRVIRDVAIVWIGAKLIGALRAASIAFAANPLGALLLAAVAGTVYLDVVLTEHKRKADVIKKGNQNRAKELGITDFEFATLNSSSPAHMQENLKERIATGSLTADDKRALGRVTHSKALSSKDFGRSDVVRDAVEILSKAERDRIKEKVAKNAADRLANEKDKNAYENAMKGKKAQDAMDERFKTDNKKPPVNIKVDKIVMNQNFDEGDPDRIALAIRGAIAQPFIPRLTSSFNPAG